MRDNPPPVTFSTLFSDANPESWFGLVADPRLQRLAAEYRPWRKFKHAATESGLNPDNAWRAAKFARLQTWRELKELKREDGRPFGYSFGPPLLEPLHRVDRATGGGGPAALHPDTGALADETSRRRFTIRTLMDEAAESSLIEGAATTRKEALELLRSGRPPKSVGERMVLNNYIAMGQIKTWTDRSLSVEMLLELQSILTEGTLDDWTQAGRLRRPDEAIRVEDTRDGSVIHVPPPAQNLPHRLKALCNFANRPHVGDEFLHPIAKASVLHFMVGYEHPFVDGNGRTARAVFYWYALRNGYTIFEYLGVSEIIRKGFARYPQAYLDTEQDDGDLTYFILYKLDVIEQALDQLALHIQREEVKIKQSERLLKLSRDLNLRQRLLLEHALRHAGSLYTVKSHMNSNGIAINTARTDLDDLVRRRLLTTSRRGKEVIYHPAPGLNDRLARKGI